MLDRTKHLLIPKPNTSAFEISVGDAVLEITSSFVSVDSEGAVRSPSRGGLCVPQQIVDLTDSQQLGLVIAFGRAVKQVAVLDGKAYPIAAQCTKCIVSTAIEDVSIGEDGVCNLCRSELQCERIWTSDRLEFEEVLTRLRKRSGRAAVDCIVAASGGKDSAMVLLLAKQVMGLNPLAVHVDNGFIPTETQSQLRKLCGRLEIPLVEYRINLFGSGSEGEVSSATTSPCSVCIPLVFRAVGELSRAWSCPFVFTGHRYMPCLRRLARWTKHPPDELIECLSPLAARQLSEQRQLKLLADSGWQQTSIPGNTSNCLLVAYAASNFHKRNGFSPHLAELSKEIRNKVISRDLAIEKASEPKLPESMAYQIETLVAQETQKAHSDWPADSHPTGVLPNSRFQEWIARPFISLSSLSITECPLWVQGIRFYWEALTDLSKPYLSLQRTLPSGFRNALLLDAGLSHNIAEDPRDLFSKVDNERWRLLCRFLNDWEALCKESKVRLLALLRGMGLYQLILALAPRVSAEALNEGGHDVSICLIRASAEYVVNMGPRRVHEYSDANLGEYIRISALAPTNLCAPLFASIKIFVHYNKCRADLAVQKYWFDRCQKLFESCQNGQSKVDENLLLSIYYRAAAMMPMALGRLDEMSRVMDLAERHALQVSVSCDRDRLVYRENLHPVLESRVKEALFCNDLDLALERSARLVDLDPYDAKVWLEHGDVQRNLQLFDEAAESYLTAATLGTPATATGKYMAALAYEKAGKVGLAAILFKEAIETDPLSISPAERLLKLPSRGLAGALRKWSIENGAY